MEKFLPMEVESKTQTIKYTLPGLFNHAGKKPLTINNKDGLKIRWS